MLKLLILHGPNLNTLGTRQPEIYGSRSFDDFLADLRLEFHEIDLHYFQSNHEGRLIDYLQESGAQFHGILLNAGGLSHTSVSLADAVAAISVPVLEIHISHVFAREPFRHQSFLSPVCKGLICGLGLHGYRMGIQYFQQHVSEYENKMVTFSPGPSQVYPQLEGYLSEAFQSGILSVSHRSAAFNALSAETISLIRSKLAVPDDYTILYTGSATECWEIIAQSLTRRQSVHFSSGSFGDKWHHYAACIHPQSQRVSMALNEPLYVPYLDVKEDDEIICLTQNETSNGTQIDFDTLAAVRGAFPDKLIALDCTSSMAGLHLPFALGDIWFASVQKCFGLPAGLGLMILSPAAVERALEIGDNSRYNSLIVMLEHMKNFQTSCTPNVLGIFLLNRVLQQVPRIEEVDALLRRRMEHYLPLFFNNSNMRPLISNPKVQSVTVLAVETEPEFLAGLKAEAAATGIQLGSGYGKWKSNTFRIANFPAISAAQTEALMDFFKKEI